MMARFQRTFGTPRRQLIAILLVALALRLAYVLAQDFDAYYTKGGGDTVWYLENGYTLVTGENPTGKHDVSRLPTAPLYLVFLGVWQALLTPQAAIIVILISQALAGVAVVYFAYDITRHLARDTRAGLLAAGVLAISPQLVLEAGRILTESLFLALVMSGLWVYATRAFRDRTPPSLSACILAGILFGLAALTRAVLLLFPIGLALHLMFVYRGRGWRCALALLVSFALVVATWTAYNWVKWDRLVIGSEGFWSFLYQGTTDKASPTELDAALNVTPENADEQRQDAIQEGVQEGIFKNPLGWAAHRVRELGSAYLQPHNTNVFKGKSLRTAVSRWARADRSPGGLIDLTRIQSFWPKLALYIFHFSGLLMGVAGMWLNRGGWRTWFILYSLIAYFTGIHLVLLALPRYLFPTYPILWIFAAVLIIAVSDRLAQAHDIPSDQGTSVGESVP